LPKKIIENVGRRPQTSGIMLSGVQRQSINGAALE
jgi:hypothetical protein